MTSEIASRDISIVVQGPVVGRADDPPAKRFTRRCLESLRRHLAGAEIVLSTYKNSVTDGLSYDVLVESDDPGGHIQNDVLRVWNNGNRQIVTTRAGLDNASRPFVAKFRGDMIMTGSRWLEYVGKFPRRASEWCVLEERLLACTVYARNPQSPYCFPFHPSDWFFFGRRKDLLDLWDVSLQPEPETSRYYENRPRPDRDVIESNLMRYTPEQYLWVTFLRKHGEIKFDHCHDYSGDAVRLTELTFANNLVLLEPWQLQIQFLKYPIRLHDWCTLYTHGDWLRMYRRYCDPDLRPGPDFTKMKRRLLYHAYLRPRWWAFQMKERLLRSRRPLADRAVARKA